MKLVLALFAGSLTAVLAADLPVRQVILYKHGVGYFERSGELQPGETARLDFRASEMDDVLKSLTIQEGNGGRVSGVRYDSNEPLAQRLAKLERRMAELERERLPLGQWLADPESYADKEKLQPALLREAALRLEIERAEEEWLALQAELELLDS